MSYLKEAEEAARAVRNNDWANVKTAGTYYPSISGNTWILNSGTQNISGFTRSIIISDVSRDSISGNISSTGTVPDPSVKKVDISVSWTTPFYSHVDSTFYVSRYLSNTPLAGSGTIQPFSGNGNWCTPSLSITNVDLSGQGVPNAVSAISGQVFAATGANASGVSFADVLLTDPAYPSPPVSTLNGTFNGFKTNGIFGDSSYAYITTDTNSKEVVIIDLAHKDISNKFLLAGVFDAPGNTSAKGIFVTATYGYMTTGSKMFNFNKVGSSLPLDNNGVALDGLGQRISVVGNYAYVATDSTGNQLNIIDISNPSDLKKVDTVHVDGKAGKDVFINTAGTRAYLVTASSASQREFFIINIDKTSANYKQIISSYDTSGMNPTGVSVVTPKKGIIVGIGGLEYQVIDLSDETNIPSTPCGTLNIDSGINGVSSILTTSTPPRAYSYIITSVHSKELQIIEGGSGGGGGTGMFESTTFDAGHDVAFNYFTATADPNLTYKFSIKHGISGSCAGVTFSDSDYNLLPIGSLPLTTIGAGYTNPGQCMRYRVTNSASSAVSYSLTINYSP